jgi:hypothetical protein
MHEQTYRVGDRVKHYVDGDTGTIIEHKPATDREPEHYIVNWETEQGPYGHVPDELRPA